MKAVVISSDSKANCVAIQCQEGTVIIDCGVSASALLNVLPCYGIAPATIKAVLVTHEHSDHSKGVKRLMEMTGARAFCPQGTAEHLVIESTPVDEPTEIMPGIMAQSFPVPHDAKDPVGFTVTIWEDDREIKIGYVTDIGYVTRHIADCLQGSELLFLEANHDKRMLDDSPKHGSVKYRVNSYHGHLCNEDAHGLISHLSKHGLKTAVLCHLSRDANNPQLALSVAVNGPQGWTGGPHGVEVKIAEKGAVINL